MSEQVPTPQNGAIDYVAVEQSPRFLRLKRTQRSFVFPLAAFFLVWYFVYVLLAAFARDFMALRTFGGGEARRVRFGG
ncbi:DUF485 domain-containing protein [Microbacterium paraoxydans]